MNRLERLIHRIVNPITVSKEDAWDSVKGYWDDVVGNYWADVDEDLTEELGVTPAALSELLEVHRHTFDYANIGGNSSVRGYDHGEDWFVVMFSDGSRYLYTLKSTTREALDWMRKYAQEGKGLNSYLMRLQRENYAGRNYKGTITIRPGMESYNPLGYRRLTLLQAFRNTMEQNIVSNEGVWDALKRLFSSAPADKDKPAPSAPPEYVWEAASNIENSPPHQLTQTSSTSPIFQKNGTFNPNWVKQLEADLKQYKRVTAELTSYDQKLKAWVRAWEPKLNDFLGDADRPEEFAATLKEWNRAQPKPWSEVWRNSYDFVGYGKDNWLDGESGFNYSAMSGAKTVTVPAQSEEQTRRIVKLISELGDFLVYTFEVSDKLTWVGYDFTDAPFRGYYDVDIVVDQLNQAKYTSETSVSPFNHFEVIEHRIEDILTALVSYVKSTGSNSVGNEVYMHTTLKRYKEQIAQAGSDGLDPLARKLMYVGLECMGAITQVATEQFDKEQCQTQNLEGIVDGALLGKSQASNEGIWGAVRYLFGGNYEDLPKINAAYDEAVDAVKATYGNPEWVKKRRLNTDKPIKLAAHYFSEIARDPAKALARVKRANSKAVTEVIEYVKGEVEYLSKFTKALSMGDEAKIKALLDMFEIREPRALNVAEELGFDDRGEVKGMSAEQIHKAAEVFIDGINYRRSTDAFYTQGMYKLMYTEAGNIRYGDGGAVTEKLQGPARELAIKIGKSADNVERSFYSSFGPAWENVDRVIRSTLAIMESSAK